MSGVRISNANEENGITVLLSSEEKNNKTTEAF